MIVLYEANETNFNHNGITTLIDTTRCKVHRELNGIWELELEYPLFDNKNKYLRIQESRILKVPTPSGNQLFRIRKLEKTFDSVKVYATHVFFDLADNFIADTNIVGKTRGEAIQQILNNTMSTHNFVYIGTDGTEQKTSRIVRKNPINAILGTDDNSIFQRWNGGELEIDNFNISSADEIGVDNGILISYKKNLTGIKETLDMSNIATRIIPQGYDGLLLPEYYIDSPYIGNYYQAFIRHMKFDEVKVVTDPGEGEVAVTEAEALQQLRDIVGRLYTETKVDIPSFNYEVSFVNIGNTEEYKQFKDLYLVNIGDKIIVRHSDLGIDLTGRIIDYVYDCIVLEHEKIEIGTIKKNLTLEINKVVADVQFTREKIEMEVSSLDERLSTKIEITETGINTTITDVQNNLQTQITENANGIITKVSSSDYESYKIQTADEIASKITSDQAQSIATQTVDSFSTEVSNTYSTKSEVTQTAESIEMKFTSGGYNLLRNSNFANKDTYGWWFWGGCSKYGDIDYFKNVGDMYISNNSENIGGLWQRSIPMKPNCKYTLSVLATKEINVINAGFHLEYCSDEDCDNVLEGQWIELNFDGQRHSYTFTTPNNSSIKYAKMGFRHDGSYNSVGGYLVYINKPCLSEGEVAVWTPHPSELIEGYTRVDKSGIEVVNGALKVTNANSQVVIDGQYNIHKIIITGIMEMEMPIGIQDRNFYITHGFGYHPHVACEQMMNNEGKGVPLPAFSLGSEVSLDSGDKGLGFDMIIRNWTTTNELYFNIKRSSSRSGQIDTVQVRYFIYQEVAF